MSKALFPATFPALLFAALPLPGATGVFHEQIIPGVPAGATELVRGPDGGFWFTEFDGNRIGTISRDGVFREFVVPTPDSGPRGIAASVNAIWFTEFKAGKIGKLTADGVFAEYAIPSPRSAPWEITFWAPTRDLQGMWFTESGASRISRITEDGTITQKTIPTVGSEPRGIASTGADLCFAEFQANQIGCLDYLGVIRERQIPTSNSGPEAIGMDNLGNIWFTEPLANRIGVVRLFNAPSLVDARIEEFAIPTSASGPAGLAVEYSQGSAWFTEKSAGQIGFISPEGRITEYPLSDRSSQPTGIFIDIQTEFLEAGANRLVRVEPDAVLVGGAGTSGSWQTEYRLANVEDISVTAFASRSPRPADISPAPPQFRRKIPPNASAAIGTHELPFFGLAIVFVRMLDDGVLPSVKARIFNTNSPSQSLDLPTIRLSRLTDLNPSLLSFPGAVKSGLAHSNLWLVEASQREPLDVVIELIASDGTVVATGEETLGAGGSIYLVDEIARLGVESFPEGQLRLRKVGGGGLLWGYLATVDSDGAISIYSGLNP
jgi:virginiamycin B lyase